MLFLVATNVVAARMPTVWNAARSCQLFPLAPVVLGKKVKQDLVFRVKLHLKLSLS